VFVRLLGSPRQLAAVTESTHAPARTNRASLTLFSIAVHRNKQFSLAVDSVSAERPAAPTIPPRRPSLHWSSYVFSPLFRHLVRSRAARRLRRARRHTSPCLVVAHRAARAGRARPVRSDAAAPRDSAQLSAVGALALPVRVHSPGNPPVLR